LYIYCHEKEIHPHCKRNIVARKKLVWSTSAGILRSGLSTQIHRHKLKLRPALTTTIELSLPKKTRIYSGKYKKLAKQKMSGTDILFLNVQVYRAHHR